jgi:hypothetical protein
MRQVRASRHKLRVQDHGEWPSARRLSELFGAGIGEPPPGDIECNVKMVT